MTCANSGVSHRVVRALPVVGLCVVLVVTAGCSSREDSAPSSSSAPPSSQPSVDDDFLPTVTAALSEGQLTLNNRWTQADLDFENITEPISYEGADQPVGRMRSHTTLVQQYRARLKQCVEDANTFYPPQTFSIPLEGDYHFQDRKCYPTLTFPPHGLQESVVGPAGFSALHRYGYYCGGGITPFRPFAAGAPEPLDGVDYCCRLHDAQAWGLFALPSSFPSECGIAMCLSKASGLPANVIAQLPLVEAARQFWYDGAALVCGGNQSNDAQPPVLGP